MMTVINIMNEVKSYGAELYIENGLLKGKNTGNLPNSLRLKIKEHVQEIVEAITDLQKPYLADNGDLIIPANCPPNISGGRMVNQFRKLYGSWRLQVKLLPSISIKTLT